jgi:hypothetical protein
VTGREQQFPPTQELVLEVLAARYRLGEHGWTFARRPAIRTALQCLADDGLIGYKAGVVQGTFLAWLTDSGRKETLSASYHPPSPVLVDSDTMPWAQMDCPSCGAVIRARLVPLTPSQ